MTDYPARALARVVLRYASSILPQDRHDWSAAMDGELQVIEQPWPALAFATGCLWASIRERNASMSSVQKSIHAAAILALAGLALISAFATNNLLAIHGPTAAVFAILCLIYLCAGLLTFMRGGDALVRAAWLMLGTSVLAFVALPFVQSRLLNGDLYHALSAESMAIWIVLLGLGVAMRHQTIADWNLTARP